MRFTCDLSAVFRKILGRNMDSLSLFQQGIWLIKKFYRCVPKERSLNSTNPLFVCANTRFPEFYFYS